MTGWQRQSPGPNCPSLTNPTNHLRPPAGSSRRLFQPVRGQLSSAAARDVCKASRDCNCEGYCAGGGHLLETNMPYGKCRHCIYCRTRSGKTFDTRTKELNCRFSVSEEQAEELEHKEGYFLCCRKSPISTEFGKSIFPSLDSVIVALGELGCGEFELDPNALLDEDE